MPKRYIGLIIIQGPPRQECNTPSDLWDKPRSKNNYTILFPLAAYGFIVLVQHIWARLVALRHSVLGNG
jgi:hypothetical protein